MPSSSLDSRERREKHRDSAYRGSRLPKLDIPEEAEDEPQSPSPRSELLSPSTTDRRREHSGHGSSTKKRHARSSGRQSSHGGSHRSRDVAHSDASHRELLHIVIEQENQVKKLQETLDATRKDLEEESKKAIELEQVTQETVDKLRQLNESRLQAQQEANSASQELRLHQLQLRNAQAEVTAARDLAKHLEKQKEEAEQSAARARAKARKLHQRQLVWQAREEGRKMGFEAGLQQAQEDYNHLIPAPPERPRESSSRRRRRWKERSVTPPPPSPPVDDPVENNDNYDYQDEFEHDGDTMRTDDIRSPEPFIPRHNIGVSSHVSEPSSSTQAQSQPRPRARAQPPSNPSRALSPSPSIPIQVYPIDIPPADQIVNAQNQPRGEWVTAQKYQELHGNVPSPRPASGGNVPPPPAPVVAAVEPAQQEAPLMVMVHPQTGRVIPPPMPVFPRQEQVAFQEPRLALKSAGSSKKIRFPSLAKMKAQAASWYRSFSLRKKSKQEIDPRDEDQGLSSEPQSATTESHHPNTASGSGVMVVGEDNVYRYQPELPTSWYTRSKPSEAKSQRSRHSRVPSALDGGDGVSRASTTFSDFDMIKSVPGRYQDEGSISGRSARDNTRHLAQKLSIIKEDPLSRGNTPQTDRRGSALGYGVPLAAPNFVMPPQSEAGSVGSTRTGRRRPPEITVVNPNGLENPFVQANWPPNPDPIPHTMGAPSSRSNSIKIDVQPATSAPEPSARVVPPPMDTHLSPHYVYQPLRPSQSYAPSIISRKSHHSIHSKHRATQSFAEPNLHPSDARSMRSAHSRSASAGPYPPDLLAPSGSSHRTSRIMEQPPLNVSSRPTSVRSYAPQNPAGSQQSLVDPRVVHRSPSRSSMHSRYDPSTYLDPAYYAVQNPQLLSPNMTHQRVPSPGLEYVDPPQ